jgi:amino acid adenylation domain-containing protein
MLLQNWADKAAQRRPESVALCDHGETLSYGELSVISNQIARTLVESGCTSGDRVCLLMPKSLMAIAAILGIYKAECIYVPLDVHNPVARLTRIVQSCQPACILATGESADKLDGILEQGSLRNSIVIGWLDLAQLQRPAHPQDFTLQDVFSCPASPIVCRSKGDSPAHILFTSGSTGEPKGVVITHANVITFVDWAVKYFGIGADERLSAHSPLHFDLSVFDIFGAQAAGAEMHIVGGEVTLLPHKLAQWIRDAELTQWFSVPSLLNYMSKFDAVKMHDFPSLKRLLWCGEVLPTPSLQYWMQRLPHVSFTNLYGPTEATIASSYYTVPECPADTRQPIPIGEACGGEELLVLDEQLQPTPAGAEGDLYIGGDGLAQGYWRDPEKTQSVFIPDPAQRDGRIYKTGDRAFVGADGLVYFVGRNDQQIKSRGFRIDLGEIESALSTLTYLREAAVVAVADDSFANVAICCAYAHTGEFAVTPAKLKTDLGNLVPHYMIPSRWQALPKLPATANGKVDRRKVREIFESDETVARRQA